MTVALSSSAVNSRLREVVPGAVVEEGLDWVRVQPERIADVCRFLKDTEGLEFDFPESVSAVDYVDRFEIVYHLLSLRRNQMFVVKTDVYDRAEPALPSVTSLWAGANQQEREVYDLMGIVFEGHPAMKRILLWDGFEGYPLRKDYRADVVPQPRGMGL